MTQEIWREALDDPDHPLYTAAWLVFSETMKVDFALNKLEAQKDEVIPFLYAVLEVPELQEVESLGGGDAPIHAVALLGGWKVTEAAPRLLALIEDIDFDLVLHNRVLLSLSAMADDIVDEVLAFAEAHPEDDGLLFAIASILSDTDADPRAFEFCRSLFEAQEDVDDIEIMAENLLACDAEKGIAFLEEQLAQKDYPEEAQESLRTLIEETREDEF